MASSNTTMKRKKNITLKTKMIKKEKSVFILGDSMVKHINDWEISKRLMQCKVHVKHFSIAKTQCMKDHLKPSLRQNLSNFILHVGTNNLKSDKSDNSKRVKAPHLYNSRLHLNKKESKVLSDVYCKEIVKSFKRHTFSNSGFDENNSNDSPQLDK